MHDDIIMFSLKYCIATLYMSIQNNSKNLHALIRYMSFLSTKTSYLQVHVHYYLLLQKYWDTRINNINQRPSPGDNVTKLAFYNTKNIK